MEAGGPRRRKAKVSCNAEVALAFKSFVRIATLGILWSALTDEDLQVQWKIELERRHGPAEGGATPEGVAEKLVSSTWKTERPLLGHG